MPPESHREQRNAAAKIRIPSSKNPIHTQRPQPSPPAARILGLLGGGPSGFLGGSSSGGGGGEGGRGAIVATRFPPPPPRSLEG